MHNQNLNEKLFITASFITLVRHFKINHLVYVINFQCIHICVIYGIHLNVNITKRIVWSQTSNTLFCKFRLGHILAGHNHTSRRRPGCSPAGPNFSVLVKSRALSTSHDPAPDWLFSLEYSPSEAGLAFRPKLWLWLQLKSFRPL